MNGVEGYEIPPETSSNPKKAHDCRNANVFKDKIYHRTCNLAEILGSSVGDAMSVIQTLRLPWQTSNLQFLSLFKPLWTSYSTALLPHLI